MTRDGAGNPSVGGSPARIVGGRSGAGELGDGFFGAGVVDEALAVGGGGHEGGGGGVVERPGQPVGVAVKPGCGVIGDERVVAAGDRQVVAQVADGLGQVHPADGVADADALVERGEDALPETGGQCGLA
jgi:hypothetical protein